ncbi:MAG: hypothetical protein HY934_09005 [Candidatus Firestonebacteria bacterium]|nr:hypothetical protein [Candidatus Firestonebacteria bacterium]
MQKIIIILSLCYFFIFHIHSVIYGEIDIKWQGTIDYSHINYNKNDKTETPLAYDEINFFPKMDLSLSEFLHIGMEGDLRKSFQLDERTYSDFRELYFEIEYKNELIFKIGRQIIEWGRTDTIKPTNVFNVRDWTDLPLDINIGINAFKFTRLLGMHELEFVYAPLFEVDRLPYLRKNRWFIFPLEDEGNTYIYDIEKNKAPGDINQFGLRFNYIGSGFDLALVGAKIYDRVPTYFSKQVKNIDINKNEVLLQIMPYYKSIYLIGMNGAATVSQYGFRSELAYVLTEDNKNNNILIDDPYLQFVIGADHTFLDIIRDWDLFMLIQYALDKELPVLGEENQETESGKFKHFYRQAGLINSEFKFSEFKKIAIKGFRNLEKDDYIIKAEYIYKPVDVLEISISAEYPGGRKDGFFGYFDRNDRIIAGIKYYY